MRLLLVLVSLIPQNAAQGCRSDVDNSRCIPKAGAPSRFQWIYEGGDPCFLWENGRRYCLVDTDPGLIHQCTCTAECGCSGKIVASTTPSCPANSPPDTEDCSDRSQYCALGSDNTMCRFCGIGPECNDAVCSNELSTQEIQEIVDKHNELRSKVATGNQAGQPAATNMNKLVWDEELARIAQRWADQCPDNPPHDPNRKSPLFVNEPGQNKADSWSSVNNFDWRLSTKIQAWYDEVKDFPAANVDNFSQNGATGLIGHYTQMVWGETKRIGCGVMYYRDARPFAARFPFRKTFVCNYYPPGNFLGRRVYKQARRESQIASDCRNGSDNGLCL